MDLDRCCYGHGLTRSAFIGRGAAVVGAAVAASSALPAAASADPTDGNRQIPHPGQIPDTQLAQAVTAFAAAAYPQFLADHCRRSYEVAVLIAATEGISVDLEVLYAAVQLHDLGLTPKFHSASERFEVASADAARSFVRDHGLSPARAEDVWDAVVLHGTGGIAAFKSVETSVAADAIGRDVTGEDLDEFPVDVVDQIMATRPGFAQPFIDAIVTDLQDKPQVANSTWMMLIAEAHIPSFQPVSVETLAFSDPFEYAPSSMVGPQVGS